jgi:hypothetical protein
MGRGLTRVHANQNPKPKFEWDADQNENGGFYTPKKHNVLTLSPLVGLFCAPLGLKFFDLIRFFCFDPRPIKGFDFNPRESALIRVQ